MAFSRMATWQSSMATSTSAPSPVVGALVEGGDDADRGEQPGRDVADRRADPGRLAAFGPGDAHDAAERLHHHVVGRAVAHRPRLAEARDAGLDEPGPAPVYLGPRVAEVGHGARAGSSRRARRPGRAGPRRPPRSSAVLEVEVDRLLAAVERGEVRGLPVAGTGRCERASSPWRGRSTLMMRAPRSAEHERAVRPGQHPRQVDDDDAGQRPAPAATEPPASRRAAWSAERGQRRMIGTVGQGSASPYGKEAACGSECSPVAATCPG